MSIARCSIGARLARSVAQLCGYECTFMEKQSDKQGLIVIV